MLPYLGDQFGNPSSSHPFGTAAKRAVERARAQVAALLNCSPAEVVFTSGGTESNNAAITGIAFAERERGNHIVTSAVEHPAVMEVCRWLETQGFRITVLSVDATGRVDPADLERVISEETVLVTVMHANNEVGTIEPISELAAIAHRYGAVMHTDAAQSVGKIPVLVEELGVDLLSVAGHKLYAPKGVGALYVRNGIRPAKLLHGASHEAGRRPGTENVLGIVGLGKACEVARRDLTNHMSHMQTMRDRLYDGLQAGLGSAVVRLNGDPDKRLPNTLSVSFREIDANTLLSEIGDRVAASAGAACHAENVEVSPVLTALGVSTDWALGTVRFSVGRETTLRQVDHAVEIVSAAVRRLQPASEGAAHVGRPEGGQYRLTQYTHGLGCACKLRPQALEEVLRSLPRAIDPAVLVGADTADDAAVYRLSPELAVVQTLDFFTPIVDDPYWFGAIAAANALSDVYAMGARPLFGLNIVGFPSRRLPLSVLHDILQGALDKAAEAGISIVGGHTVDDSEPKFGMAITGLVHPDRILRNSTAQPGDLLVLTKPLGVGIIATALKRGLADAETAQTAIASMAGLNRKAGEVMVQTGANACTDVTGFGLLGHLREMAQGSHVDISLSASSVPVLPGALALVAADVVPGGTIDNLAFVGDSVRFDSDVSRPIQLLLADAQTSGGLLISVPASTHEALLQALKNEGVETAATIGKVTAAGTGRITVHA